jgi:hypothetical protein
MASLASPDEILTTLSERFTPDALAEFDSLLASPGATEWEHPVIVGLACRCFNLQKHLRRAHEESDPQYLAWAARTLVEIKVFAEFVSSSKENMRRFFQDLFVDGNTALKVASKSLDLLPADHPGVPPGRKIVDDSRPALKQYSDANAACGLEGFLSPALLAKSQGIEAEFKMSHTALSKFTHATAASTLMALAPSERSNQFSPFLQLGADNAVSALNKLQQYIRSRGQMA